VIIAFLLGLVSIGSAIRIWSDPNCQSLAFFEAEQQIRRTIPVSCLPSGGGADLWALLFFVLGLIPVGYGVFLLLDEFGPTVPKSKFDTPVPQKPRAEMDHEVQSNLATGSPVTHDSDLAAVVVTFDANGGSGSAGSFAYGEAASGSWFTRDGYLLTGWNSVADGTGVSYAVAVVNSFTADVTLYAQWGDSSLSMKQLWQLASGSPVTQDAGLGELSMKQVWEQVEEKIAALPPAFPPALIADWLGERIDNPISYTNNSMRVEHLYPAWDHIFDPSVSFADGWSISASEITMVRHSLDSSGEITGGLVGIPEPTSLRMHIEGSGNPELLAKIVVLTVTVKFLVDSFYPDGLQSGEVAGNLNHKTLRLGSSLVQIMREVVRVNSHGSESDKASLHIYKSLLDQVPANDLAYFASHC